MAIAAVEDYRRPMDIPVAGVDPSPGALDLPQMEHRETCSRCDRPAVDTRRDCGSPVCENCLTQTR